MSNALEDIIFDLLTYRLTRRTQDFVKKQNLFLVLFFLFVFFQTLN